MYSNGSIVRLEVEKSHGEGEARLFVSQGLIGMIASGTPSEPGRHRYVVDFGPEGQWNCMHNELHLESGEEIPDHPEEDDDYEVAYEEQDDRSGEEVSIGSEPAFTELQGDIIDRGKKGTSSFEKDLERMMKKLEKERGY